MLRIRGSPIHRGVLLFFFVISTKVEIYITNIIHGGEKFITELFMFRSIKICGSVYSYI